MLRPSILLLFGMSACGADETLTGYASGTFALTHLDGVEVTAPATLVLADPGRISGTAPCNSYSATQSAPYPWFDAGPIAATRRACPDIAAETAYLAALAEMEFAEAADNVLILSSSTGRELVFQLRP